MPLVSADELGLVLDETLTPERFNALYNVGLKVIRTGYRGDPEAASPETIDAVSGVLFGVLVRIASNPKGARQLNAGGAGLTFGGSDSDIATVFSLTDDERRDLAAVSPLKVTGGSVAFTIRPQRT